MATSLQKILSSKVLFYEREIQEYKPNLFTSGQTEIHRPIYILKYGYCRKKNDSWFSKIKYQVRFLDQYVQKEGL